MPLHAPLPSQVLDPEPPAPPREPLPPKVPPAAPYATWTPNGGPELILSESPSSGIMLGGVDDPRAVLGLDMPPESQFDAELAAGDGSIPIGRRSLARSPGLPIVIHADTLEELEQLRRTLMASFNPRRGHGVLRWALPGGSARECTARYSSGLEESEEGRQASGRYYNSYLVELLAHDPYWYGDEKRISFNAPAGDDFYGFGEGAPPYVISESDTFGEVAIDIDGEVEVFPTWELTGPMTTATLSHPTEGELDLTPDLAAGETLTIRTDRRVVASRKFTREDGSNVWGEVAGDFPVLWPLQPGRQTITVFAAGTVAGQSLIRLRYRPRYLTA